MATKKGQKKLPSSNRRVDVAAAMQMRVQKQMSYAAIARQFGVSRQAVTKAIKQFEELVLEPGELEAYRSNKATLLESAEAKLLCQVVNPEKIKSASLNNVAYALGQVSNMTRLEQGKSTANIAYQDLSADLAELQAQRRQLEEQLQVLEGRE